MPLQNRVTPLGELVADPARGLVYGNRGCLHGAAGRIRRHYGVRRWISCRLEFKGWQRPRLLQPGKFTELFFLDEATALAAGHRPCALCRREDYNRFVARWTALHPADIGADEIDTRLHGERFDVETRQRRLHRVALDDVPDGAFVLQGSAPHLVRGARLLRWTPGGYTEARPRARGVDATLITPPSLAALLDGWQSVVPLLHPSAANSALLQR